MYQFKIFVYFCGICLIASFIVYSVYRVAECYFGYIDSFSVEIAEIKAPVAQKRAIYTSAMTVKEIIKFYAIVFGVDVDTALKIAQCESGFNPRAENINGSATGVYQFTRKTFKNYCSGDVYNADHNIICFVQQYPKHPEWWDDSKSCWGMN